jgi:hypothetical protein
MSTAPAQLSPQDFAAKIRAKYPGAYDSLSDADLTAKVVAKHPEYQSVVGASNSGSSPVSGGVTEGHNVPPQPEGFWHSLASVAGIPTNEDESKQFVNDKVRHLANLTASGNLLDPMSYMMGTPAEMHPSVVQGANKTGQEASATVQSLKQKQYLDAAGHAAGTLGYGASTALTPVGGAGLQKAGEQFGEGNIKGGLGTTTGIIAPLAVSDVASSPTARALFQNDLAATSHDILNKGAVDVKSKLWDAHNQVSQRVGQLKNDIASADYQAGPPSIPTADLQSKVLDLSDKYRASDSNTPAFSTAAKRIADLPANLSFKDLADLKSEVGTKWSKTPDGTPDSAAINELRSTIDQKLSDRATDLDRTKQYGAFNKLWSTLMGYESDGVMGKLLNADNGAKFMDVLKDPANKAEIARTVDSLQNFGLDPDTLKNFQQAHEPLHRFVSNPGMISKLRLVLEHPATAIPGMIAGGLVGSAIPLPGMTAIGGAGGAYASSRIASRISAARAVAKLGVPELTGEMSEAAQVKPVGSGDKPIPPVPVAPSTPSGGGNPSGAADAKAIADKYANSPKSPEYGGESQPAPNVTVNAVDPKKVVEFGQALGFKKADAIARAKEAIAANPYDLEAAQDYVAGKRTDKAAQIQNIKTNGSSESAASQEAINRTASEKSQSIQRIRIDTRSGKETPLIGVDAVDATPGPYDVIVKRSPSGDQVLDRGGNVHKVYNSPKVTNLSERIKNSRNQK